MISASWTISLISGAIILLFTIPTLLWLRYGKSGKSIFGQIQRDELKKELQLLEQKLEELKFEISMIDEKLSRVQKETHRQFLHNKKKKLKKELEKILKIITNKNKHLKN